MSPEIALGSAENRKLSVTRPVGLGQFVYVFFSEYEALVLIVTLLTILGSSLFLAHHKPYWFDEVLSLMIASQPDIHGLMRSMTADVSPPLSNLLIRSTLHLLGPNNISARLPSMIAFLVACLAVYQFVRRRCGVPSAFLALALVATQPAFAYSYEARPYTLLLAFTAITLVSWQIASEQRTRRGIALFCMSFGIAGAMLSHQLGIVEVGFPILCGEIWRWRSSRRLDWLGYAPFLIALPVLCITLPMARHAQMALRPFFTATATTHTFAGTFVRSTLDVRKSISQVLGLPFLLLVIPLFFFFQKKFSNKFRVQAANATFAIPGHEVAAAIGAALLIPVTLIVLLPAKGPYNCRYGIVTIVGISILGAFGMARYLPERKNILVAMILLCGAAFGVQGWRNYIAMKQVTFPTFVTQSPQILNLPVVTTEAFNAYPLWWYATDSQRARFTLVYDSQALKGMEVFAEIERNNFPIHVEAYDEYLQNHRHFTSIVTRQSFLDRAMQLSFTVTPVGNRNDNTFDLEKLSR